MFNLFKKEEKEHNYFITFEEQSQLILDLTELLSLTLEKDELLSLDKKLIEAKNIQVEAEEKKEAILYHLYEDFLPPLEREDIIELLRALDNVLENIADLLFRMDIYQIQTISEDLLSFLNLVEKASNENMTMIKELSKYKKPKKIILSIKKINEIKLEGDSLYHQAIKNIYSDEKDSFRRIRYSKVYDGFYETMHSFKELTNSIETMIIKNT